MSSTAGVESDTVNNLIAKPSLPSSPTGGSTTFWTNAKAILSIRSSSSVPPSRQRRSGLPTLHGNLIVGPTRADGEKDDLATTAAAGFLYLPQRGAPARSFGSPLDPQLFRYARASEIDDFIIGESKTVKHLSSRRHQSPGLTSAPRRRGHDPILGELGLKMEQKQCYYDEREVVSFKRSTAKPKRTDRKNPPTAGSSAAVRHYRGRNLDALHSPITPRSIEAIKRRCNAGWAAAGGISGAEGAGHHLPRTEHSKAGRAAG